MSSRAQRMEAEMSREFEGTFVPENRSQSGCFGTTKFLPEVVEEEARIVRNDRLRTRRPNKTFRSKEKVRRADGWGRQVREVVETRDEWMLSEAFVALDEIVDPRTDFQVQEEVVDDNE